MAANVAANVLAMLTLSCYNQKMFGTVNTRHANTSIHDCVRRSKHIYFSEHTLGGIPLNNSLRLERELKNVFGITRNPKTEEACSSSRELPITESKEEQQTTKFEIGDIDVVDMLRNTQPAPLSCKKSEVDSPSVRSLISNIDDEAVAEAILFFNKSKVSPSVASDTTTAEKINESSSSSSSCLAVTESCSTSSTYGQNILKCIDSLNGALNRWDFNHKISKNNDMGSINDTIMTILTGLLKSNGRMQQQTIMGLDDMRNMSYCAKVMDLFIILYLNLCGQQDPSVTDEQFFPVIHSELIAQQCTSKSLKSYFNAAMLEISIEVNVCFSFPETPILLTL